METLNREKWLQIAQNGVDNLYGERRKNARLLKEAIQTQPEGSIYLEQVICAINQSTAHSDTKIDAIKMAKTLQNKVVATQEMKAMLEEEEILAKQRQREESEFNDMTIEERAKRFKLSDDPLLNLELHKLAKQINATPGRKRPRSPGKWLKLKQWEMERNGAKIGETGPVPDELRAEMKALIKEREEDDSGFTDVENLNWDEL